MTTPNEKTEANQTLDQEIQAIAASISPEQLHDAARNMGSYKEGSTPMMRVQPLNMVAFDLPPQET